MARELNRLTARQVAALKTPGQHADGGGLYLAIDASGRRRWLFRFKWQGSVKDMGLGSVATTSLAEAREEATKARKLVASGVNPVSERNRRSADEAAEEAKRKTFGEVADSVIAELRPTWSNQKHAFQWAHSLTVHAARLRPKVLDDISTEDVLAVLKPLWNKHAETASRLRGRIEHVIDAGFATRDVKPFNPARWRGHLDKLLASPKKLSAGRRGHVAAMPFDEVAAFVADLRQRSGVAALALEFLILTATRTGEVIGARWSEVDTTRADWSIPAERMKAKKPHRVPLCPRALEILEAARMLPRMKGCDHVFPNLKGDGPLSNMAFAALLKRMERDDATTHGFRSSFRDWCAERTNFPNEVAEAALAHIVTNKVEAAYRRGDLFEKRRALMATWAGFLERPAGGSVVPMARVV